jgi:hypothetical protein
MYKITNVTDRKGVVKQEFFDDMKAKHGDELLGDFIYYDYMKSNIEYKPSCCFEWADDSGKMMRTSYVESVTEHDNIIKITTRNSVYEFEKVEDGL